MLLVNDTMSCLSVTDKYVAIARGLQVDLYDYTKHILIEVPSTAQNDQINGVIVSSDSKHLAVTTNVAKQLILYELPGSKNCKVFDLPRSSSKMRFTSSNSHVLLADKSGDVLRFDINVEDAVNQPKGQKIFGHLSLILDVLQSSNGKYVISSDRDEKIKVSCYPNTYEIQTYCLGHKEFVNHIEELPHNAKYLLSSSGDGTVKIWDYIKGKNCYTIDTFSDVNNVKLRDSFKEKMDEEVPIVSLPIIHLTVTKLNENCSILVVSVHTYEMLLIYSLEDVDGKLSHKLETKLKIDKFPTGVQFHDSTLVVYNDVDCNITFYSMLYSNGTVSFDKSKVEKVFNASSDCEGNIHNHFETIKLLFKRKFDNVQEYQERKKLRLEKSAIKNGDYTMFLFHPSIDNLHKNY